MAKVTDMVAALALPVVERAERTLALARATGKWDGGED